MKLTSLISASAILVASVAFSTAASAKVFTVDYHDDALWSAYDDTNEVYGMKFKDDGTKDGFWLVVSDGPNPKTNANEYAILYGDLNANRITAYTYDGLDGPNSYQTGTFLGSYDGAFQDGGTHATYGFDLTMFSLDVSAINAAFDTPDWDGVQHGALSGMWFHQSVDSQFAYNADGSLAGYSFSDQMWVDAAYDQSGMLNSLDCASGQTSAFYLNACNPTQFKPAGNGSVPAPGGLALLMAGLIGLGLRRRG